MGNFEKYRADIYQKVLDVDAKGVKRIKNIFLYPTVIYKMNHDNIYCDALNIDENGYKKRYTLVQKYQAKERFAKGKVGQIFIDSDSMQPFLNSKKK